MVGTKSTAYLMREWRTITGLSASDAGARLGLSGRTIEDIEQGRSRAGDVLAQLGLQKLIEEAKGRTASKVYLAP